MAKIYVASSWRNTDHPNVISALRQCGHEVYDFRHPADGGPPCNVSGGFCWERIDSGWKEWTSEQLREALQHPLAQEGFHCDMAALRWADVCILVTPCGNSAHLELGWAEGRGMPTAILLCGNDRPDLMYNMVDMVAVDLGELVDWLDSQPFENSR